MKKILGITFGGLQRRLIGLVLTVLVTAAAVFAGVSAYQNRRLSSIVGEARTMQQQAISRTSQETMHSMLTSAMVQASRMEATIADNDFAEVVSDARMLQTMAQGLFENRASLKPVSFGLPDPALDGIPSAMVLCEQGVDYTQSPYLGIAAHLSSPMIAMLSNSDKIDGVYIGFADGTDLCVDEKPAAKLDENGNLIPFPVRQRPWYTGAAESGELHFTSMLEDAFTGEILITCSAPVYAEGELIGVVGLDIVMESMNDFLGTASEGGGSIFLIDERGEIILSSESEGVFAADAGSVGAEQHAQGEDFARFAGQALSAETELALIAVDGREYYMVGTPMPTVGWAVINAVDRERTEIPEKTLLEEYDRINAESSRKFNDGTGRLKQTSLLILLAVFFLSSLIALRSAKKIVDPIEEMTRDIARSSRTGDLFRMKDCYRTDDEIEVLAESFDDLSKKTKQYISQITAITAEKERISTELSLATRIQSAMMPHIFPPFPGRSELDIYASMDPAKEVGGDFYDFFLVDEDHLCMVIADVSGKGVPAALFMMASKIILQSCAMLGQSPAEILTKTNTAICSNNQEEMFVTAWVGILELSTGKLTAANAGHEYPVLKKSEKDAFELVKDRHGFVIGGMDGISYREYELRLQPGAKIFLYTDGVPEAMDAEGAMFGTQRMLEALNKDPGAPAEQILKNVRQAVDSYVKDAEQFDDLTMLCVEYRGPAEVPRIGETAEL